MNEVTRLYEILGVGLQAEPLFWLTLTVAVTQLIIYRDLGLFPLLIQLLFPIVSFKVVFNYFILIMKDTLCIKFVYFLDQQLWH